MENIRVIKLNPNTFISNVSTFDEAFDDYSFASGRRAKRQARRLEKQQARQELLQAKAETKKARVGKRTARKVAKQEGKDTVQSMRRARRTARAEDVQARRTGRKTARLDRRALGRELEPEIDETINNGAIDSGYSENETIGGEYTGVPPQGYQEDEGYQGGGQYDEPVRGLPPRGYQQDEGYEGGYAPESDEWGAEPNYMEDDANMGDYEEDYGSEYDSYNTEDDVDFNFDGNIQNNDEFYDLEQASQVIQIPDAITITADAIEWNKELYARLDGKRKEIVQVNPNANIDKLDSQLSDRKDRIADLEDMLDGWADCRYNYDANNQFQEFPKMDIDYSNADGKNKFAKMKRNRYKQVQKAKENAKKKRERITLVKTSLNPIFENGKIVVPSPNPSSGFNGIPQGTGLNGLDNSDDFDAPPTLTYEITSNADGGKTKWNTNGIILGVGIAVLGIWAIKKYKLIK
jgi:hypothetical protein